MYRIALATALIGLYSWPAAAQNAPCGSMTNAKTILSQKYGESPVVSLIIMWNKIPMQAMIFANAETGTWTIMGSDNKGCVQPMLAGKDWVLGMELLGPTKPGEDA